MFVPAPQAEGGGKNFGEFFFKRERKKGFD